jgi:beta-mannosidase
VTADLGLVGCGEEEGDGDGGRRYLPGLAVFSGRVVVEDARLWWPAGYGEQPLYRVDVSVTRGGDEVIDRWSGRIGLRTIKLVRATDCDTGGKKLQMCQYGLEEEEKGEEESASATGDGDVDEVREGESFMFVVNGRRLFAKGANYIPVQALFTDSTKEDYESVVEAAVDANMNMLRVWGGGAYENDAFYDTCDARGILLWHDFMFACSLYPGDPEFLASCRVEATHQVARLRNRACMALWCGNNELEQIPHEIVATEARRAAYNSLFNEILPGVVVASKTQTPYWPSSPHNPAGFEKGFNSPRAGDTHYWDVWHARKPVAAYLQHSSRFCSEFGMQSYLSLAGTRSFAGADASLNIYSPMMEAHQKNSGGNMIISEYCRRLFQAPKDFEAVSYQSQINQAYCVQTGVEHFRRSWPFCAGSIFWQVSCCF